MRSHQMRMKRYAGMIVKSMQRRERQSCGAIRANEAARIDRLGRESRELKNLNFGGYSRRVNKSGACSSSDVITWSNNNGGQINRCCMWVPGAVRYYFVLLQKQEYILQREWSCLAEAPPMMFRCEWSEFHGANEASKLTMFKHSSTRE